MARNTTVGIDIGTHQVKVAVSLGVRGQRGLEPKIIGAGQCETKGLRHGYIVSSSDVSNSIRRAIAQAENSSKQKIRRAFLSVGGIGLSSVISNGAVVISRADAEITELDLSKVIETSEKEIPASVILNKKVIHAIPIQYKLDGKPVLGRPLGMKGSRLEAKMLFITCLEHHLNDLIEAVEGAGVEVIDVMASPLAAGLVTLTKTQKIAGCVLVNIGSETVSMVVYENNIPVSLEVFSTGSTDITNDLALGLKMSLEEAEQIKLGAVTASSYPRKKIDEIISARLADIFDLIQAHLKKIGRDGLLPAGVVLIGGGSAIGGIEELAKQSLSLPARVATIFISEDGQSNIKESSWAVAFGLCVFGLTVDSESVVRVGMFGRKIKHALSSFIRQFLP